MVVQAEARAVLCIIASAVPLLMLRVWRWPCYVLVRPLAVSCSHIAAAALQRSQRCRCMPNVNKQRPTPICGGAVGRQREVHGFTGRGSHGVIPCQAVVAGAASARAAVPAAGKAGLRAVQQSSVYLKGLPFWHTAQHFQQLSSCARLGGRSATRRSWRFGKWRWQLLLRPLTLRGRLTLRLGRLTLRPQLLLLVRQHKLHTAGAGARCNSLWSSARAAYTPCLCQAPPHRRQLRCTVQNILAELEVRLYLRERRRER